MKQTNSTLNSSRWTSVPLRTRCKLLVDKPLAKLERRSILRRLVPTAENVNVEAKGGLLVTLSRWPKDKSIKDGFLLRFAEAGGKFVVCWNSDAGDWDKV